MHTNGIISVAGVVMALGLSVGLANNSRAEEKGLAGYWKLDEGEGDTVRDASGSGNNGMIHGAKWTDGKLTFDGSGDYVDCGDGTSLDITGAITIEAWIKLHSLGSVQSIVSRDNNTDRNFGIQIVATNRLNFYVVRVEAYDSSITGNTIFTTGVWYHIAGTYNGSEQKVFVNGVSDSRPLTRTTNIDDDDVSLTIGAQEDGVDRLCKGTISEVRIYNRALTEKEIEGHYKAGRETVEGKTFAVDKGKGDARSKSQRRKEIVDPANKPVSSQADSLGCKYIPEWAKYDTFRWCILQAEYNRSVTLSNFYDDPVLDYKYEGYADVIDLPYWGLSYGSFQVYFWYSVECLRVPPDYKTYSSGWNFTDFAAEISKMHKKGMHVIPYENASDAYCDVNHNPWLSWKLFLEHAPAFMSETGCDGWYLDCPPSSHKYYKEARDMVESVVPHKYSLYDEFSASVGRERDYLDGSLLNGHHFTISGSDPTWGPRFSLPRQRHPIYLGEKMVNSESSCMNDFRAILWMGYNSAPQNLQKTKVVIVEDVGISVPPEEFRQFFALANLQAKVVDVLTSLKVYSKISGPFNSNLLINKFVSEDGDKRAYTLWNKNATNILSGELIKLPYDRDYHWVSLRISGAHKLQTRIDGTNIYLGIEKLKGRTTITQEDEDLCLLELRKVLEVGRAGETKFRVKVNKSYAENLVLEIAYRHDGINKTEKVMVLGNEATIDLSDIFGTTRIEPNDEIAFELYREHPIEYFEDWDLIHFLEDAVVVKGYEAPIICRITAFPNNVQKGDNIRLKASVFNTGNVDKNVTAAWCLPTGINTTEGSSRTNIVIHAGETKEISLGVGISDLAKFGGQKIEIGADYGLEQINGKDKQTMLVCGGDNWNKDFTRIMVSVETAGISGVDIPVAGRIDCSAHVDMFSNQYLDLSTIKVVELDQNGKIIDPNITSYFVKDPDFNPTTNIKGEVAWKVEGTRKKQRDFYIYFKTTSVDSSKSYAGDPVWNRRKLTLNAGDHLVSNENFRRCTVEIRMKLGAAQSDSFYGWRDPSDPICPSTSFDILLYDGSKKWMFPLPAHAWDTAFMTWHYRKPFNITEDQVRLPSEKMSSTSGLVAEFDNTSGETEYSAQKDLGWRDGNSRIDRYNSGDYHNYKICWTRWWQRWYIDNELVYSRELALAEANPLLLWNEASKTEIEWIKIGSEYAGETCISDKWEKGNRLQND